MASHINLALNYLSVGEFEKAVEEARVATRMNPASGAAYANLIAAYLALDRIDEARLTYDEAIQHNIDNPNLRELRYYIAFLQNDQPEMHRQVHASAGLPSAETLLLADQAETAAYFGRLQEAREATEQAIAAARAEGNNQTGALWLSRAAFREALFGNFQAARLQVARALGLSRERDVRVAAALSLATIGDIRTAQIVNELNTEFALDPIIQKYWLPTIRASLALSRSDTKQAVTALEVSIPYELGMEDLSSMVPIYVRGTAYLEASRAREATSEFNRILGHRGLAGNAPVAALAQLQIARSMLMRKEKASARRLYQEFLALWKDADPDIPIYKQAKAEYARLQ